MPHFLTGQTVAVVGSGPSGLAAAQQLTRAGHTVAVFERADRIGGLLRYGVPDFKLEKRLIDRRIAQMEAEGTRFRTGVEVGKDITWTELLARYDAVLVTIGSTTPRLLTTPGSDLDGVVPAVRFLTQNNKVRAGDDVPDQITATGKHVVVIGGGDTGSDCVGTSLRHGATSVTSLEIVPQPPVAAAGEPALAHLPDDVQGLDLARGGRHAGVPGVDHRARRGRAGPGPGAAAGDGRADPGRAVRPGRGHRAGDPGRPGAARDGLHRAGDRDAGGADRRGPARRWAPSRVATTSPPSVPGMFVAGDAGRGQSLIVWAIAEGRAAAAGVDAWLRGTSELHRPIAPTDRPLRA